MGLRNFLLLGIFAILPTQAGGRTLLLPAIESAKGIGALELVMEQEPEAQDPGQPLFVCAEYAPVPKTLLCLSNFVETMNLAFLRSSIWTEGLYGNPFHVVVDHGNRSYLQNLERARGHDLRSLDLFNFFNAVDSLCGTEKRYCLSSVEADFRKAVFTPFARLNQSFVLLGFALRRNIFSKPPYRPFLGHEIYHSQYFNSLRYRDVVNKFWKTMVSESDKEKIKTQLRQTYNIDDSNHPDLLLNEFQAYLLQPEANQAMLKDFVSRYQAELKRMLAEHGIVLHSIE